MATEGLRFRLIDLIGAMTALAMLLALVLPLVHSTREPSRSAICATRLRELVKATQLFETTKKRYPGYVEAFGRDAGGNCKIGTWAVTLFPYIEQEPLYDAWQDPTTTAAWNSAGRMRSAAAAQELYPNIELLTCPADSQNVEPFARNSYACNAGFFPDSLPPSYQGMNAHQIAQRSSDPTNGVFSNRLPATVSTCHTGGAPMPILGSRSMRPTRRADIKDGLTQTIALSENLQADSWGYVGSPWNWKLTTIGGVTYAGDDLDPADSPRVHVGLVWLYRAQPSIAGVAPVQPTNRINGNHLTVKAINRESARPSSRHNGVAYVGMLGGSVSAISENIDYIVYQALMTPDTRSSDIPDRSYVLKEEDAYRQ